MKNANALLIVAFVFSLAWGQATLAAPWTPTPRPNVTTTKPATPRPNSTPTKTPTPRPNITTTKPATPRPATPRPTTAVVGTVQIVSVDKADELIIIKNMTNAAINLNGWYLVSEAGNQRCDLRGSIPANAQWKVRTRAGTGGDINCGFSAPILNNSTSDPTSLYNSKGELISHYND